MFETSSDFFVDLLRACIDGRESEAAAAIARYGSPWPAFARKWFNARLDAPINGAYDSGKTPLAEALSRGRQSIALALLAAGARPETTDSEGATTLHWAARKGCSDYLVQACSNRKLSAVAALADSNGDTALHAAALLSSDACALALIAAGSPIEALNKRAMAPLHYAAQADSSECARALVASGANPRAKDALGRTPLLIAALAGSPSLKALALSEILDEPDMGGASPLATACRHGRLESAQALLKLGARADASGTATASPLSLASSGGHRALVLLLLDSGADIDAVDARGRSASMLAAEHNQPEIQSLLASRGARASARPLRPDSQA
jgi:ankyrin repeat protein